jgi:hypothetical protein
MAVEEGSKSGGRPSLVLVSATAAEHDDLVEHTVRIRERAG